MLIFTERILPIFILVTFFSGILWLLFGKNKNKVRNAGHNLLYCVTIRNSSPDVEEEFRVITDEANEQIRPNYLGLKNE